MSNTLVLVKYSFLKPPAWFVTSVNNLKINDIIFFYEDSVKKFGIVLSVTVNSDKEKQIEKKYFVSGKANSDEVSKYKKDIFKNEYFVKVANTEAERRSVNILFLFCEFNDIDNCYVMIFVSEQKNNLEDFFSILKEDVLKIKNIRFKKISSRERAMIVGGIGPCCLRLCCHSLRNVKYQKFEKKKFETININNINGVCNKIKCCLSFDEEINENQKEDE